MKSTGKAESVLAGPLDTCLRLVQEDLSGTAEYWPCISFTSHCCWSIFLLFHCKPCVIAACKWDRVRTCLQTELRLFSSFVWWLEGILPWEDEGQTSQQTSFLQGLFSVFNPRYFLFKFKRKSDWIFKLLLNWLLNRQTYSPYGFSEFFFLEDKTLAPHVFSSCSFIPRADFETSLVMTSSYGYEIWRYK